MFSSDVSTPHVPVNSIDAAVLVRVCPERAGARHPLMWWLGVVVIVARIVAPRLLCKAHRRITRRTPETRHASIYTEVQRMLLKQPRKNITFTKPCDLFLKHVHELANGTHPRGWFLQVTRIKGFLTSRTIQQIYSN